jgi:hypothetical protein
LLPPLLGQPPGLLLGLLQAVPNDHLVNFREPNEFGHPFEGVAEDAVVGVAHHLRKLLTKGELEG